MGKGSQWHLGSAVSGDGRELLQEGFLAECVEGQVPPDVGTNGSNLGRWKGQRQREESITNSRGQCLRLCAARRKTHVFLSTLTRFMRNLAASARRLVHGNMSVLL